MSQNNTYLVFRLKPIPSRCRTRCLCKGVAGSERIRSSLPRYFHHPKGMLVCSLLLLNASHAAMAVALVYQSLGTDERAELANRENQLIHSNTSSGCTLRLSTIPSVWVMYGCVERGDFKYAYERQTKHTWV